MRALGLVAALLLLAAGAWWFRDDRGPDREPRRETPPAPTAPPAPGKPEHMITGRVTGPDGAPVAGARVAAGGVTATTDAHGAYRLVGVPNRRVRVKVEARGFATRTSGPVLLLRGESAEGIDLELAAAFTVKGRALKLDGAPLKEPFVEVLHGAGRYTWVRGAADGTFSSEPIPLPDPPRVCVRILDSWIGFPTTGEIEVARGRTIDLGDVHAVPFARLGGTVVLPPGVTFAETRVASGPAVATPDAAGRFELNDVIPGDVELVVRGAERDFRVVERLRLEPGEYRSGVIARVAPLLSIRGRLVDHAGEPLAGRTVIAFPPDWVAYGGFAWKPVECHFAKTGPDGRFEVEDLQPGRYGVALEVGEGQSVEIGAWPRPVTVDAGASGVEMRLTRAGVCAGRVVHAGAGAYDSVFVQVVRLGGCGPWPWQSALHRVEPEPAAFDLPIREAGRYQLRVSLEGYADTYTEPFDIGGDNRVEVGDVALHRSDLLAAIVPGATHACVVDERTRGHYDVAEADQKGRFVLTGLPPGRFTVVARGAAGLGIRTGVERGDTVGFELRPGAGHTVRIVGRVDRPVSVRSIPEGLVHPLAFEAAWVDSDGRIDKSFLPEGPVTFVIRAGDGPPVRREVVWPPGPPREIEIRLD